MKYYRILLPLVFCSLLSLDLTSQEPIFAYKGNKPNPSSERTEYAVYTAATNNTPRIGCSHGDCYEGIGVLEYADGSKYEGNFVDGEMTGYGTWYFPSGEKYVGMFRDNFCHGRGVHYTNTGDKVSGLWHNGTYIGHLFNEDGQEGCTSGDCESGEGVYVYKGGKAKYEGQFFQGKPNGSGVCHYSDGNWYDGAWAGGSFDGVGSMYMLDGRVVEGIWKNGTFQGKDYNQSMIQNVTENFIREGSEDQIAIDEALDIKIWAVVVGVSSYKHMQPLQYTDDDAYRMYAHLKSPEGGALKDEQIKILIDDAATKDNILNSMNEVFGKAGPNDLILMYYSGHGLEGSFLPIDFDGQNNKLFHDEVSSLFNSSRAKYKLFIADACHSGGMFKSKGAVNNTLENYYHSLAQAAPGTALILSSKSGETSLESTGLRQGVFSHFLLRGLKGEADADYNNIVTVEELYGFIAGNVQDYTANQQSPVIQGNYDRNMTVSVLR